MIFRIRSKLLLYFIVLVVLLNGVAFFLYKGSEKMLHEYDDSFQRFLVLNEISQQTNLVMEKLHAYLVEKDDQYYREYKQEKRKLLQQKQKLSKAWPNDNITLTNYENMIDSFLEEGEQTIHAFRRGDINVYSSHLKEATKIAGFIQETTLSLLNKELTNYEWFYADMKKRSHYYNLMGLSLFSFTLLLSTLLALWLSGGITKPIRQLSAAAKDISKGRLTGDDIQVSTNDEMKILAETFNQMRHNIRQLVTEIQQKSELDKLLKELELKSLQNQINPHFLFNVLNTVSKMAFLEDAPQTSRLIESVSTLLRYNLGDVNKPSTLGEEVRIVKEYFFIQQTRFFDRIKFITDIDDHCLNREIPRLTLQPIVENAFIHGVESSEEGATISLKIFKREDNIIIEITDNGVGMDEQTRERLLQYTKGIDVEPSIKQGKTSGHSTGIGVKNVIKRMQLFYQRNDVVEIESEPGKGTTFRLIIPEEERREQVC
jgi:sensor histidine kinase YesM